MITETFYPLILLGPDCSSPWGIIQPFTFTFLKWVWCYHHELNKTWGPQLSITIHIKGCWIIPKIIPEDHCFTHYMMSFWDELLSLCKWSEPSQCTVNILYHFNETDTLLYLPLCSCYTQSSKLSNINGQHGCSNTELYLCSSISTAQSKIDQLLQRTDKFFPGKNTNIWAQFTRKLLKFPTHSALSMSMTNQNVLWFAYSVRRSIKSLQDYLIQLEQTHKFL